MILRHDFETLDALVNGPLPPEMEEIEDEPFFTAEEMEDFSHEDDLNGILGFEGEE